MHPAILNQQTPNDEWIAASPDIRTDLGTEKDH